MTRKSRREIERAVEDLTADAPDAPRTPEDAATVAILTAGDAGDAEPVFHFQHDEGSADVPEDAVPVGIGQTFVWYAPVEYVPEEFRDALPARLPRKMSVTLDEVDT